MPWYKNRLVLTGATPLVLLTVVGLGYAMVHKSPPKPTSSNFNTISDTSTGITFNMSRSLEPIPKDELAALNPGFNYGFKPANDANTSCIISQAQLKGSGAITGAQLKEGLFKEVKKTHPDVKLNNDNVSANLVQFGEAKGVLLDLSYKEAKYDIRRIEVIAVGKKSQVIAYCQSLATDSTKYYNDFSVFFSSLKVQ